MADASATVPDFGAVVHRATLVRLFETRAPVLTVVCAPAGYGKSILASQFARVGQFEAAHWADFEGRIVSADDLLARVSVSLTPPEVGVSGGGVATALPVSRLTRPDALLSLRDDLSRYRHRATCLILDGLDSVEDLGDVKLLAELLQECSSNRSRVVLTCRSLPSRAASVSDDLWLIDECDLRFTKDEARQLADVAWGGTCDDDAVEYLLERSGGQPALLNVMVRHRNLAEDPDNGVPQDLLWYLEQAVGRLDDVSIRALYVAALVGEGRLSELGDAVSLTTAEWHRISAAVPLLVLTAHEIAGFADFRVHSALADALSESAACRITEPERRGLRLKALELLRARGDNARIAAVLVRHATVDERVACCASSGSSLLRSVGPVAMSYLLDLLPQAELATRPELLLLLASVLREQAQLEQALEKASIARALAEHVGDWPLIVDASLVICRIALDLGDLPSVERALSALDADSSSRLAPSSRCLVHAYMAVVDSQSGRRESAERHVAAVQCWLERLDPASEAAIFAGNCVVGVNGSCFGQWAAAAEALSRMVARRGLTPVQRLLLRANYACAELELGRLDQSERELALCLAEIEQCGIRQIKGYVLGTLSALAAARGDEVACVEAHSEATVYLHEIGDALGVSADSATWAMSARAMGLLEQSLAAAEAAVAALGQLHVSAGLDLQAARVEVAASLLALGDVASAVSRATEVKRALESSGADHYLLRADMILAEAQRLEGRVEAAVELIAAHKDYVLTESSNWQIAQYIRAFPALLTLYAAALGPSALPVHMIRLVPIRCLDASLSVSGGLLDRATVAALVARFGSSSASDVASEQSPVSPCYVRLFGGLRVTTEFGEVLESAWSKRKARLLFAMLAARRGQEIPRDVLLERLWSDMDEDRARNNFYVMWSAMKLALACGGKAQVAAKYVRNTGGLCSISPLVRSDLDDFEEALKSLMTAESSGHGEGVLAAAQKISDLYRGEFLPGDVYEDWFAELRDRYRHDFCDAMLSASSVAERAGDHGRAVSFLRRALSADPWREDLYQAAMRCQMQAGQRSGAIETYFSCRNKLGDDLGIDPSYETQRLYESVLAMEEAPRGESAE